MHGWTWTLIGWVSSILLVTPALGQGAAPPVAADAVSPTAAESAADDSATASAGSEFPFEGEVIGDSVYVRSGAGVNWYPTSKLSRGTIVRVMGERSGWLRIIPPPGSFSYVDAAAIERTPDSDRGVTKVDGVYVKAGGELSSRKTAAQQILPRGSEVTILGESEGFLKIVPPSGSYLYISAQYVKPVGPDGPKFARQESESATPPTRAAAKSAGPLEPPSSVVPAHREAPVESTGGLTTIIGSAPGGKYRTMLESVEADLRARLASDQSGGYQELIDRYKPIADQSEDRVAQAVAKARLDQLQSRAELEQIVADARHKTASTEAFVQKLGEDRQRIQDAKLPPEKRYWDFKGELRKSLAFDVPNRFRLADPETNKTLAYIDVPRQTGIDATQFLNRYVGIRISSQYFSTAAKVTIAVASEIVALPSPIPGQPPPVTHAMPAETSIVSAPPAAMPAIISSPPVVSPQPAYQPGNVERIEATAVRP